MGDEYRVITTRFRQISPSGKAVMVDKPPGRGHDWAVIPRSLIHGADDLKLDGYFGGEEITLRVMAWKAEELGWVGKAPRPVATPAKGQGRLL